MPTLSRMAMLAVATVSAASLSSQDAVLQWNAAALAAIRAEGTSPPAASRNLAMLHAAMHDAISGIARRYDQYLVPPNVAANASQVAAGSSAAHDVLLAAYPLQRTPIDQLDAAILATVADGERKTRGIAWGREVASALIAARTNDGSQIPGSYPGSNEPGMWRPHRSFGGLVRPALLPAWGRVRPFAVQAGSQFRPPPPPRLDSFQYGIETLITQFWGGTEPRFRTPEQTEIAKFWAYGPRTATPAGHWNQIAQAVAGQRHDRLDENARLFALLNIVMADAAIGCWDCKYQFGLWRPITAIQLADQDGNPITFPEPEWLPLLDTPPFPEYTSGHSTFSGAAALILARVYGTDRVTFTVGSDDLPNVRRTYHSFSEAASESGLSRILGGIHFWSANLYGLGTGVQAGDYVWNHVLRRR